MTDISDWKLERYRLGESSEAEQRTISAALETDATLRARLEALATDDAATLASLPPARVAKRVQQLAQPRRTQWLVPAIAMATVLLGVVTWSLRPIDDDVVRFKGEGPTLRLYRLEGETPKRLEDGSRVKPHDVVQVAFDLSGAIHAVVVSVDGAGNSTLHWPHGPDTRVPDGFNKLPQSFELDAAPGFERFFLVTSEQPLSPGELLDAAKQAARDGALTIPPSATQRTLRLDKP